MFKQTLTLALLGGLAAPGCGTKADPVLTQTEFDLTVAKDRAPRVSEASSRLRSIWLMEAMPARTPTGMLRNTKQITMIIAVPVISIGGTLKAKT